MSEVKIDNVKIATDPDGIINRLGGAWMFLKCFFAILIFGSVTLNQRNPKNE